MGLFNIFKKKKASAGSTAGKRRDPERREPPAKAKKEIKPPRAGDWRAFFKRLGRPRWRIPWWFQVWREIPWWGRGLIIAGIAGIVLAVLFAVRPGCAPEPSYRLSVAVNPVEAGEVGSSPAYDEYGAGTQVTLTAAPSAGYEFASWSGDASGTEPVVTVTMDSNKSVTANFRVIQYTLATSVSPPGGGLVSPGGGIYDIGSTITLTATPAADYEFVSWSGDASGTEPVVTITMDSNKSVTANFVATIQEIREILPSGISGSAVVFSNVLERGEIIEGFVELTGEYYSQDWSFDWNFELINPEGREVDYWQGHWVKNNHHDFSFKAQYSGSYKIRVRHNSLYDKDLLLKIRPKGWSYSS
jgi:uncharacterized repeat protein (TIGR02543 family)